MKCHRCLTGRKARFRVYSDVIDMKVCPGCAAEAQNLGLTVQLLHPEDVKKGGANGGVSSGVERDMRVDTLQA